MHPGCMAPPITCLTWAEKGDFGILHHTDVRAWMTALLDDPEVLFIGHNVAFDFGLIASEYPDLIPAIFKAYEDNRVTCSMIRQQMLDIAAGCYRGKFDRDGKTWIKFGYSLFDLTRRLAGRILKKDGWRLRYGEIRDIPISGWIAKACEMQRDAQARLASGNFGSYDPKDLQAIVADDPGQIIEYPLDDAKWTLFCFERQSVGAGQCQEHEDCRDTPALGIACAGGTYLVDQFRQARAAFALHLSSCWGMRTNPEGVEQLRVLTESQIVDVRARLIATGLVRADGSRDTKKAAEYMVEVCRRDNIPLRQTKLGGVSLDAESCLATQDPVLLDYERYTGLGKTLNADYPMLLAASVYPCHPRYGIAETGRITCSGPNLTNVSKK